MKIRPYRPSNGTEGEIFMEQWCERCQHDDQEFEEYCPIVADTMAFDIGDKDYPKEWIYKPGTDIPICTNFKLETRPKVRIDCKICGKKFKEYEIWAWHMENRHPLYEVKK
jgi:hypothetical protein